MQDMLSENAHNKNVMHEIRINKSKTEISINSKSIISCYIFKNFILTS